jgi:hypothetical protein
MYIAGIKPNAGTGFIVGMVNAFIAYKIMDRFD